MPAQERDSDEEPAERDLLPWFKDPKQKVSVWAIIKDNIGKKDLTTISLPVYMNEPLSLLQKICTMGEYISIISEANK